VEFQGNQIDGSRAPPRKASASKKQSALLSNHEYFRPGYEAGIEEIIAYLKNNKPKQGGMGGGIM
jgi:hypothetical protein